jgi:hypothetical protein
VTSEPVMPGDGPRSVSAANPAACGAGKPAASALPGRIRGVLLAVRPGRQAQPSANPEILHRILDGLNRL